MNKTISINNFTISNDHPLVLLAGPCQIENLDHSLFMADALTKITKRLNIPFIYKSSFDKANRTSHLGARGVGIIKGIPICFCDLETRQLKE